MAHCKAAGYEEVFVQAEKVDQYALDFYRSPPENFILHSPKDYRNDQLL
ncbi:MAG: hypothetical protein WD398_14830 [Cyclobacteriaceae bacterium]